MNHRYCPGCGGPVPTTAMNISEGVALCSNCGELSRLSDIVETKTPRDEILAHRPPGCQLIDRGLGTVVYCSSRSWTSFFGAAAAGLFWNGIVSVFVMFAIAGLYSNFIGPVPDWMPAPEMNEKPMTLGMTIFLCVFLMPFVVIGTFLVLAAIYSLVGKVEVQVSDNEAKVKTGIGFVTWNRKFDPTEVRRVLIRTGPSKMNSEYEETRVVIEGKQKKIECGAQLSTERREWLKAVLHVLLIEKDDDRRRKLMSQALQRSTF